MKQVPPLRCGMTTEEEELAVRRSATGGGSGMVSTRRTALAEDLDVVGFGGSGWLDLFGGNEVEPDAVAEGLAADAVELRAVAQGDVLGGIGRQRRQRADCQHRQSGAEDGRLHRTATIVADAVRRGKGTLGAP